MERLCRMEKYKNNINNTELSNTESNHIISENDGMGFDVAAYSEIILELLEVTMEEESANIMVVVLLLLKRMEQY